MAGCWWLVVLQLVLGAAARDWSCAREDPKWHFRREAVRYVMWEDGAPLRTSSDRLAGLMYLFQTVSTGSSNPAKVAPGTPCPVGEIFFMLLEAVMIGIPRTQQLHTLDIAPLHQVLLLLQSRVDFAGALRSTWPIYGLLALAQQGFLGLRNDGGASPHESLVEYTTVCEAGAPLAAALDAWLRASAATTVLASLLRPAVAAARLRAQLARDGELCRRDPSARAAAGLLRVLHGFGSLNASLPAGDLDNAIGTALGRAGWMLLFFSGWPVFAVLHRIQEALFRDLHCSSAERGAYGLLTRAVPDNFWVCVRRSPDVVDERWRIQGVFNDCYYIKEAMRGWDSDCLFLDVGSNLGACAISLAHVGLDVLGFEPVPAVARLFRAAVARNRLDDKITVSEVALGREDGARGVLNCTHGQSATCNVLPSTLGNESWLASDGSSSFLSVRSSTMDAQVAARRPAQRICGVKIDVEGAEEEVLLGGAETLGRLRPLIFLELHPVDLHVRGSSPERVFDTLVRLGYTGFLPLSEDDPPSCSQGTVRGGGTFSGEYWHAADLVLSFQGVPDPCACSNACFSQILRGCRCWDFNSEILQCNLWRRCHTRRPHPAWWAGELNGVWRVAGTAPA